MFRLFVALMAFVAMLSGCGFHRQGSEPLPEVLKALYIESSDPYTDFQRSLQSSLKASGVKIVGRRADATAVLGISQDETGRRVLSVSARNTPREYEVYYKVTYAVSSKGKELLPAQPLERTRNYSFDEAAILAKEEEESILRQAMARELAGILMRQLSRL